MKIFIQLRTYIVQSVGQPFLLLFPFFWNIEGIQLQVIASSCFSSDCIKNWHLLFRSSTLLPFHSFRFVHSPNFLHLIFSSYVSPLFSTLFTYFLLLSLRTFLFSPLLQYRLLRLFSFLYNFLSATLFSRVHCFTLCFL